MKSIFLWYVLSAAFIQATVAQVKWSSSTKPADEIGWSNYSTTYIGDVSDTVPFIVTAIPYNGVYSNADDINTPLDLSFDGSLFRFRSGLADHARKLYTYDSSEVYFLTPGIYKSNAADYEYRVTLNAKNIITPWTIVNHFSDIGLNTFKKGFGFLGGYKASWGNYIIVELKRKNADTVLSSAVVYWKESKPVVGAIYTTKNLNAFFNLLKRPWDKNTTSNIPLQNPVFSPAENNIIFTLSAEVYKKEAIEYQLLKDETVYRQWQPNDVDNNFIWLKELPPGKYTLQIRYSRQRQNVSGYDFEIKPAWHQTTMFKLTAGSLIAAFFGFILLLFWSFRARKKIADEHAAKEKLHLELKAVYAQLNPHFIFNALSSIQGLVNKKDLAGANYYLSQFSSLLRNALAKANKDFITLGSEIELLEHYLQLEQLRFHFQYHIQCDKTINKVETTMPSLLLQPLVENAVKHGVSGMQGNGIITLEFIKANNDMHVVIRDNGSGFILNMQTGGYGLRLTHERIQLLNAVSSDRQIEWITPNKSSSGTKIELRFKNWLS